MGKYSAALVAVVVVGGLIFGGCGGDDENGSVAQPGSNGGSASADSAQQGADSGAEGQGSEGNSISGDSSEGLTNGGKTIAKAEFLKKADAICQARTKQIMAKVFPALGKEAKEPGDDKAAVEAEVLSKFVVPELGAEIEQLEALGAPPGDEAEIAAIMDAIREFVEEIEDDPEAVVARGNKIFDEPYGVASAYGLEACPYG